MFDFQGGWYHAAAPGLAKVLKLPRLGLPEEDEEAMRVLAASLRAPKPAGALPKLRNPPRKRIGSPSPGTTKSAFLTDVPLEEGTDVEKEYHRMEVLQRRYDIVANREERLQESIYTKMERMRFIAAQKQSGSHRTNADDDVDAVGYGVGANSKFLMEKRAQAWAKEVMLSLFTAQLVLKHSTRKAMETLHRLFLPVFKVSQQMRVMAARQRNILKRVQEENKLKPAEAFLSTHYAFKPLSTNQRGALLGQVTCRAYGKGDTILFECEPAVHFCVLAAGSAALETSAYAVVPVDGAPVVKPPQSAGLDDDPKPVALPHLGAPAVKKMRSVRRLATVDAGDSFGELCMLPDMRQVCALVAQEETVVYFISAAAMSELHRQLPDDAQRQVYDVTVARYKELLLQHFPLQAKELTKCDVFSVFSPEEVQPLIDAAELNILPVDHILFDVGDACNGCYYVARGAMLVYDHRGRLVRRATEGTLLGDGDVISVTQRSCKVVVCQPSDVWVFPKEAVNGVILRNPAYLLAFRDKINRSDERAMTMDPDYLLATVHGLSALPARVQKLIFTSARAKVFSIGELLAHRGERVHELVILVRGSLCVYGDEASGHGDYRINAPIALGYSELTNSGQWRGHHKAAEKCFAWLVSTRYLAQGRDDDKARLGHGTRAVKTIKTTSKRQKGKESTAGDPLANEMLKNDVEETDAIGKILQPDQQVSAREVQRIVKKSMRLVSYGKNVWNGGKVTDPNAKQYELTDYESQILEMHYRQKLLSMWQPTEEEIEECEVAGTEAPAVPEHVASLLGTMRGAATMKGLLAHVRQKRGMRQAVEAKEKAHVVEDLPPEEPSPAAAAPADADPEEGTASRRGSQASAASKASESGTAVEDPQ
eukprot:TRINITY_DN5196_c0_g1_i1.p1 TRINITY_DN5196_c0_g1~~TRINITY_DN5196_c0_g1_i1.p1  ORF type:complete len:881 (+),score=322.66 TRINITY_DN5196_c0_g1_i1:57-2699(+)